MSEGFAARPADITAHAATVAAVGDSVTTAAEAGATVQAGMEAYGKLCVIVPVMLGALQSTLVGGLRSAASSLHGTADDLRATASDYAATDRVREQVFRGIRDAM